MSDSPPSRFNADRTDARVLRTRGALRSALLALLEEKPFDRITVREIVARAGAGYATYFRHYPDKSSLLNDLAAAEIEALLSRTMPILNAKDSRAACLALCTYVDQRRALWSALLTGGAAGTMREQFRRQALRLVDDPRASDSWIPADLAAVFGVSAVVEILAWWLQHRDALSPGAVAEVIDRLVFKSLTRSAP
jgi:AcrR family transcriptional regulator